MTGKIESARRRSRPCFATYDPYQWSTDGTVRQSRWSILKPSPQRRLMMPTSASLPSFQMAVTSPKWHDSELDVAVTVRIMFHFYLPLAAIIQSRTDYCIFRPRPQRHPFHFNSWFCLKLDVSSLCFLRQSRCQPKGM